MREIFVVVKKGFDLNLNLLFWLVMDKVKVVNMLNDNIKWVIDKVVGNMSGENYDEVIYEGYVLGGIVVFVYVFIDNKNCMSINVCVVFNKNGGSFGEIGSVSYMFDCKGYFVILCEGLDVDEEEFMLEVIEVGVDDVEVSEDVFEIFIDLVIFLEVKEVL